MTAATIEAPQLKTYEVTEIEAPFQTADGGTVSFLKTPEGFVVRLETVQQTDVKTQSKLLQVHETLCTTEKEANRFYNMLVATYQAVGLID